MRGWFYKTAIGATAIALLLELAFWAAVVYVAIHFIRKYW